MRIIVRYCGGMLDSEVVRVYNACVAVRGFVAGRTMSVGEVRELWFGYSTFELEEFALALGDGRVYGMVFAVASCPVGRVWVCVDPALPKYCVLKVLRALLSWARFRLVRERVFVASIDCGYEHSRLHSMVREITGLVPEVTSLTLMEYGGRPAEPPKRTDIYVREGSLSDIPGVVEVWNKAFRKYSWFHEWSIDDAVRWYSTRKLMLYVATDRRRGEIVGYTDAEKRVGFDGSTYGYIYTLAVHPDAQGRGVGKVLLQHAVSELSKLKVKAVYLEAIPGLENYYAKQGFRIARRKRVLITNITNLSTETPLITKSVI